MKRPVITLSGKAAFCQTAQVRLEVGQAVGPLPDYDKRFGQTGFLALLERYRPQHLLSHAQAVVMHASLDDLENSGGEEWLYELDVVPGSRVQRHDAYWANQLAMLSVQDPADADPRQIQFAAEKYWDGESSPDPVWEYLAAQAVVVAVHSY